MSTSGSTSPSVLSDEERNSSNSSPNSIPPVDDLPNMLPTPDDISRWQSHIALEAFGKGLHVAAKAVFPNTSKTRYKKVSVLMLCWENEDPNLPVSEEIAKLDEVFKDDFGFDTEIWKIPERNSHAKLTQRILDLIDTEDDPKDHLYIVYYGGHARLTHDRLLSWTSWRANHDKKYPTVQWSGVQNVLEQAESDVLILLDCCHAATATTSEGNGVTEMISACAYNATANGVGYYSFTKELTIELRELSRKPSFGVGHLFRNVFSRIQARRPEDGRERHPAPVHFSLTQDNPQLPRSIQLSVRPGHIRKPRLFNEQTSILAPMLGSDLEDGVTGRVPRGATYSRPVEIEQPVNDTGEAFPAQMISKLPFQTPRILLAVRLKEDCFRAELSVNLFKNWLRDMPAVAEEVKVEAGFGSYSSIVIVSVPLALSLYLPQDPAIIRIGPITSENLLQQPTEAKKQGPILTWESSYLLLVWYAMTFRVTGLRWLYLAIIFVVILSLLVHMFFDVMRHLRAAGLLPWAGFLLLILPVLVLPVLNYTIDFVSTSNFYRRIWERASLWAAQIRGKLAQIYNILVPGSPFSQEKAKPDHLDQAVIPGFTHQTTDEETEEKFRKLLKRIVGTETGMTSEHAPKPVHRHEIVSQKNTYTYENIDGNREIRLLKIIHGAAEAPLKCVLFTATLPPTSESKIFSNHQPYTYIALPHCWGSDEPQNPIYLYVEVNDNIELRHSTRTLRSGILYAQDNLNAALRELRDPEVDVVVWADAICINQSDAQEKMNQARLMHEVFTQASSVVKIVCINIHRS